MYAGKSASLHIQWQVFPHHEYSATYKSVMDLKGLLLVRYLIQKRCERISDSVLLRLIAHFKRDNTYLVPEDLWPVLEKTEMPYHSVSKWVVQVLDPTGKDVATKVLWDDRRVVFERPRTSFFPVSNSNSTIKLRRNDKRRLTV